MEQELLQRIAIALEKIAGSFEGKEEVALGFSEPKGRKIVDCGRREKDPDFLWGIFNGQGEPHTKLPEQLTCKLIGLELYEKENRGKTYYKLRINVDAGERYILESSLLTQSTGHFYNNWAGSILQALNAMRDDQLQGVIVVYPRKGDDPMALFASVYVNGERIKYEGAEPPRNGHVAIIERVNRVLGYKQEAPTEAQQTPEPAPSLPPVSIKSQPKPPSVQKTPSAPGSTYEAKFRALAEALDPEEPAHAYSRIEWLAATQELRIDSLQPSDAKGLRDTILIDWAKGYLDWPEDQDERWLWTALQRCQQISKNNDELIGHWKAAIEEKSLLLNAR